MNVLCIEFLHKKILVITSQLLAFHMTFVFSNMDKDKNKNKFLEFFLCVIVDCISITTLSSMEQVLIEKVRSVNSTGAK
jgi:hypothetical protein